MGKPRHGEVMLLKVSRNDLQSFQSGLCNLPMATRIHCRVCFYCHQASRELTDVLFYFLWVRDVKTHFVLMFCFFVDNGAQCLIPLPPVLSPSNALRFVLQMALWPVEQSAILSTLAQGETNTL